MAAFNSALMALLKFSSFFSTVSSSVIGSCSCLAYLRGGSESLPKLWLSPRVGALLLGVCSSRHLDACALVLVISGAMGVGSSILSSLFSCRSNSKSCPMHASSDR